MEDEKAALSLRQRQTREAQVQAQEHMDSVSKRQRDLAAREDELARMEQVHVCVNVCAFLYVYLCVCVYKTSA